MSLDLNDERIIRAIFREELGPTKEKVQTLNQTVYGSDEKGGMRAEVMRHDGEIDSLKTSRIQVKTVLWTVFPAVQIAIVIFIEWVKAKLH
jgi:hypothetical protein